MHISKRGRRQVGLKTMKVGNKLRGHRGTRTELSASNRPITRRNSSVLSNFASRVNPVKGEAG